MALQVGKAQIFGMGLASLSFAATLNLQGIDISPQGSVDRIPGQDGEIQSVIYSQKIIELELTIIPQSTTLLLAAVAAGIPEDGTRLTTSGFPVMAIYGVADALNATLLYATEGGRINGSATAKWSMTLKIVRYPSIASLAPIT